MSLKIAICDDSSADCGYLRTMVSAWASLRKIVVDCQTFPSAEAFLFSYEEEKNWDILLLDIEMGTTDGLTLARSVRRENEIVQIIFTTGYYEYISEGYEVAALHYLVKPVNEEKLFSVLDRAVEKLRKNERFLTLELPGEIVRIPFYEILWLEVRANYVTIHAKTDCTVKRPLAEIAAELDERFFRVGRSYIINLSAVRRVSKTEVILSDGSAVPLSRGIYEPLNRAIISLT